MMDEKQIESLKRRYGSRIADAPKRRRGPERMAVMKGGKPKAGGQTMLRLLSYLKRDRMAMTVAFFCVILGTVTNLAGAYMLRPIINRYIVPLDGSRGDVAGLFRSLCVMGAVYLVSVAAAYSSRASCCRWRRTRCSGCGKSCLTICRRFRSGFMIPAATAI